MKRLKFWGACLLLMLAAAVLGGCGSGQDEHTVRDLSFTVVGENQLPQELKTMVEEKKADPFKPVSYTHLDVYKRQEPGVPAHGISLSVRAPLRGPGSALGK